MAARREGVTRDGVRWTINTAHCEGLTKAEVARRRKEIDRAIMRINSELQAREAQTSGRRDTGA
jgi:hypothetical protein